MSPKPIRVLVVDDSVVCRAILTGILDRQPDIQTIGEAESGKDAIALNRKLRPDLITMDIQMPGMDGFATIEEIMAESPVPILVVTSAPVQDGVDQTFRAIQAGALDLVAKPEPNNAHGDRLVEKVRVLSGVKVIRHRRKRARPAVVSKGGLSRQVKVVAIAASTGGPKILVEILGSLPRDLGAGVLLVQHLPDDFHPGFIQWLDQEIALDVEAAVDGGRVTPGKVLVAPGGRHLEAAPGGLVKLTSGPAVGSHRPSANPLFESVASVYGADAMGVMLSGMGRDGADGLLALRAAGGLCVAQDEATSLIFGMPRAAIEVGAAERILGIAEIAKCIQIQAGRQE